MILGDGVCHFLEQNRLTGLRRSDNQTSLAFTDRCDQVDNAHTDVAVFEPQPCVGIEGPKVVEYGTRARLASVGRR
jgi:hypothetical protein